MRAAIAVLVVVALVLVWFYMKERLTPSVRTWETIHGIFGEDDTFSDDLRMAEKMTSAPNWGRIQGMFSQASASDIITGDIGVVERLESDKLKSLQKWSNLEDVFERAPAKDFVTGDLSVERMSTREDVRRGKRNWTNLEEVFSRAPKDFVTGSLSIIERVDPNSTAELKKLQKWGNLENAFNRVPAKDFVTGDLSIVERMSERMSPPGLQKRSNLERVFSRAPLKDIITGSIGVVERLTSLYPDSIPTSYIKLYESPGQKDLAFKYETNKVGFVREVMPMNLKSVDISLPLWGTPYDELRRVDIWSINHGDNLASLEADFYNIYLDPDYALRANSAKYTKVLSVLPGQHVKVDMIVPIKRILLYAST